MALAVGVRATSFVVSAALLGLAVVAGLTMTVVQREFSISDGQRFEMFVELPPAPPPPRPRENQPPRPIDEGVIATSDPLPPADLITQVTSSAPWTHAPPAITNPQWVRRPRDLARYYPARALDRGMEGRVVLDCAVRVSGALSCNVASETPRNWGFAEAALRISSDYQMVPAMRDGAPVEARHRMVIPFELQ